MNKLHIALITAILLTGGVAAQTSAQSSGEIDTVILASTANYPDAMIASGPAQMLGAPVLLTDQEQMPESTQQALNDLEPENVVIVGGPAVVSEDVEAELEANYETTRLWGTTQIGTSVEVADYFWADAEEAVVVQYPQDEDRHQLLAEVKDEAEDSPILVSEEGSLSADVLTKLEDLGVSEVEVYSTEAVNVTQDLNDIGVEDVEINEEDGERRLEEDLQEQTNVEGKSELVIVAAANFKHTISAPSKPNSASFIVSNEEQISQAVELATEADSNTTIKVVGKPDLAQDIADQIESETEREVDHISGEEAADQAAEAVERDREEWSEMQGQKLEEWRQNMNSNPGTQKAANKTLQKAREAVDENSSEEAREALQDAEDAFEDGDYFEAKKMAVKAHSEAKMNVYAKMDREDIREQVREERQSMREFANEMKETSQEMAQELQEAESPEERREVIREYREERKDMIQDMKEEMRENSEELREDMMDRRERNRDEESGERERLRQEAGDADEVGETEATLEVDGNEVKARAEYTGSTGGYEAQRDVTVEGDQITFNLDFQSPDSDQMVIETITEYRSEMRKEVEDGNYTATVVVSVDGETKKELSRDITVPSTEEFEDEEEDSEDEENETESDDNETENETEEN